MLTACARAGVPPVVPSPVTHTILWTDSQAETRLSRFRFVPDSLRVVAGDSVRFTVGSGSPHLVEFDIERLPPEAVAHIRAAFERLDPTTAPRLHTRFFQQVGSGVTLSTEGWPPGDYGFHCVAHRALGEVGLLRVAARPR